MSYIREFMTLPEVWRYCAEFGCDVEKVEFNSDEKECWLRWNKTGLINLHILTGPMVTVHPYILRESKADFGRMLNEFLQWFLDNVPEQIQKINVPVPIFCIGAIQAAFRVGMRVEGIDRMSYLTKKGPVDRVMFGLLRGEI